MKTKKILFVAIISLCFFCKITNAQAPNWLWAQSEGGVNNESAWSVATDSQGNICVVGTFMSPTITFGSTTLTNAGSSDLFIVKYDNNGNVLWARCANGLRQDNAYSVASDASDNIYVTGLFTSDTITFGTISLVNDTNNNSADIFIAKYNANGNVQWAIRAGGQGWDYANSVAVDVLGNVYITGGFLTPELSFGTTILTNAGGYDMFLTKYDSNGNVLWAKRAGNITNDYAYSVVTDTVGKIYVAGYFTSATISFDSFILTKVGSSGSTLDLFIAKYDTNGNVLWAKSAGTIGYDNYNNYLPFIKADTYGNTYVAGHFISSTIAFGSIILTNINGYYDIFLVKYDTNGNVLWAKRAGGMNDDHASSIGVNTYGNIYLAGWFKSNNIVFGSDTLTNANTNATTDIFITKYDINGNVLWAEREGGSKSDVVWSVALDHSENTFVAGNFNSTAITFGSSSLTNSDITGSTSDILIAKFGSDTLTGINELSYPLWISVYPNPSKDKIYIYIPQKSEIEIHTIHGQIIKRIITDEKQIVIDISNFSKGVYIIKATTDSGITTKKFVKE